MVECVVTLVDGLNVSSWTTVLTSPLGSGFESRLCGDVIAKELDDVNAVFWASYSIVTSDALLEIALGKGVLSVLDDDLFAIH